LAGSGVLAVAILVATADTGSAQSPPDYYDDVVRIIEGIRSAGPPPWDPNGPIPADGALPEPVFDDAAPALALRRARDSVQRLLADADGVASFGLRKADRALRDAWSAYAGGASATGRSSETGHLRSTQKELFNAAVGLTFAAGPPRDRDPDVQRLQAEVTAISARIGADIYGVAERADVPARRLRPIARLLELAAAAEEEERYAAAVSLYGSGTILSGGTIDFDLDQFEQNIRDGLDGETIGYSYAITLFDTVHASDAVGDARILPDAGAPQQLVPDKEMFVASVSKTLTAILVLFVLELNDLDVDDPIGPWLPPEWDVGDGVAAQTFRDFLTHQTGFSQKGVDTDGDNTLAFLEDAVGIDVPADTSFSYNNANFGIFRFLVPRLGGFDFGAFPDATDEELYGGFFVYTALEFFDRVDVLLTCGPSQPDPVIYYSHPHNGFNGLQLGTDLTLQCGGYGFVASAEELAPILADLTADDELISDDSVTAMKEGQLGFFDPANGYFWGNGGLGVYHNHGGDWEAGIKGVDTCVMLFPNGVTATLLINSIGGDYGGTDLYQCALLRDAFDDAWVPG
jgi:hypothetical protein